MFKVKELRCLYQKRLKEFGYDVEINKSKFKESILNYFERYGIQEQSDGKNKILIFPEGIKSLLKMHLMYMITRKEHCYLQE